MRLSCIFYTEKVCVVSHGMAQKHSVYGNTKAEVKKMSKTKYLIRREFLNQNNNEEIVKRIIRNHMG